MLGRASMRGPEDAVWVLTRVVTDDVMRVTGTESIDGY